MRDPAPAPPRPARLRRSPADAPLDLARPSPAQMAGPAAARHRGRHGRRVCRSPPPGRRARVPSCARLPPAGSARTPARRPRAIAPPRHAIGSRRACARCWQRLSADRRWPAPHRAQRRQRQRSEMHPRPPWPLPVRSRGDARPKRPTRPAPRRPMRAAGRSRSPPTTAASRRRCSTHRQATPARRDPTPTARRIAAAAVRTRCCASQDWSATGDRAAADRRSWRQRSRPIRPPSWRALRESPDGCGVRVPLPHSASAIPPALVAPGRQAPCQPAGPTGRTLSGFVDS
jgi:hypothetical protein